MKGKILYIVSQEEGMFAGVKRQYEQTPEPKQLVVLPGRAHAQHIFKTRQKARLLDVITRFLQQ